MAYTRAIAARFFECRPVLGNLGVPVGFSMKFLRFNFNLGDNTQREVWQIIPAGNAFVSDLAGLWKIAKKDIQLEGEGFKITVSLQRRDIPALSA